jgi:hypothetical protein
MLLAMRNNNVSVIQLAEPPEIPVFEISIRKRVAKASMPSPRPEKRDNIFSKSRDTREDRGTRETKTSHNAQTLSHAR